MSTIANALLATALVSGLLRSVAGTCPGTHFDCKNGKCARAYMVCNGVDDCGNYEDERECSSARLACPALTFTCHDLKGCIPEHYVCDDSYDCSDGSDELNCGSWNTQKTTIGTQRTVAGSTRTTTTTTTTSTFPPMAKSAMGAAASSSRTSSAASMRCDVSQGRFPCLDGQCLFPGQVCDGRRDCSDGADEGRYCEVNRPAGRQQQQLQQWQHQERNRGWLVDLQLQFRLLFQPLMNSSNY